MVKPSGPISRVVTRYGRDGCDQAQRRPLRASCSRYGKVPTRNASSRHRPQERPVERSRCALAGFEGVVLRSMLATGASLGLLLAYETEAAKFALSIGDPVHSGCGNKWFGRQVDELEQRVQLWRLLDESNSRSGKLSLTNCAAHPACYAGCARSLAGLRIPGEITCPR